jgi:predicted dehydrogenase
MITLDKKPEINTEETPAFPNKIIKSAVIGAGAISKEHLSFLSKSENVDLVGVCDLSRIAAKYAQERFGAKGYFTDYQKMLEVAKPDIVHILTPANTHKKIASDCLKAGIHVFCEKPIAPTYDEFHELYNLAQSYQRHLIENQNYCFNKEILAIKKLVADGIIGEVQEVEVRLVAPIRNGGAFADENLPNPIHQMPAGVIHDFITHLCSLIVRFIPDFQTCNALWSNHGGGDLFKYDDLDAVVIGGSSHARIRFSCHTSPKCFSVIVRGSKGYVETDLFQPYLRCVIPRGGELLSPMINHFINGCNFIGATFSNFRNKIMQQTAYEGIYTLLDETYEALIHEQDLPISFEDMERTNKLINLLLLEAKKV